ncbi:MAG: hypothetical protein ACK47B_21830 [Armatimonadota bacterium]
MATPTDDLVETITAYLAAALPAELAAEGLPAVKEFLNHDPALLVLTKAPQVWVDVPADERSSAAERGATLHKYSHETTILVAITGAGPDAQTAIRHLRKSADLIRKVLEGNQTLSGLTLWVRWLRTDYSVNMGAQTSLFKEATLTFDINRRTKPGAA